MQLTSRTRALDFYGKIMAFYFVCSVIAVYTGAKNMIFHGRENQKLQMNLFSYLLPFVSFMIDASAKRVYCVTSKSIYSALKVIFTFYYLCMYVVSLNRTSSSQLYWIANGNLIAFPVLISLYWWLLIQRKLS